MTIKRHEFQYALRSSAQEGKDGLGHLIDLKIQVSPKKAPVVPKTAGQQAYLRSILSHDITFGVGPAGTGKTYLAVAMAVAALKQEKVSRIILTRPAVEAGEALGFLPATCKRRFSPTCVPSMTLSTTCWMSRKSRSTWTAA